MAELTWRSLWAETAREFGDPQARWLCERACGLDDNEFRAALDEPATERMVAHLDAMLARVRDREPLQYVLGRWGFRHLDVMVDRRVLIPRPETEMVVEVAVAAARTMNPPLMIADLGTGSGVIGLSLAAELPVDVGAIWLTDASPDALHVARANLAGLGRAAAHVRVAEGSWFAALPPGLRGAIDMVVANPPYVAVGDDSLERIVAEHEPADALFAGVDGLDHIRRILADAPQWLRADGVLVMEIGASQGDAVIALAAAAGMADVEVRLDLAGRPRVLVARRP